MDIKNINMVTRIFGGFALIIMLLLVVGVIDHLMVKRMIGESEEITHGLELDNEMAQREVDHLNWVAKVRDFLGDEAAGELKVETDYRKCGFGRWYYGEGRHQAEQLIPGIAQALARIEKPHQELHASAIAIQSTVRNEGREPAQAIYAAQTVPALRGVQGLLKEIREQAGREVGLMKETGRSTMHRASAILSGSLLFLGLIAILIGFLTYRGLVTIMGGIGREMTEGANQVSGAANEVAASSQALAEGASEQAASVEEISASLQEVASMTRRDSENISQAARLMEDAGSVIKSADGSMQRLVSSMEEIAAASAETQKIVKTIDEIAFQTNLLALNAAVEAARAGEAGAGFAVVADEVRNLAMRAAEAAKNTSSLIDGTVGRIQGGSALVRETNDSFGVVSESINRLSTLINEIANSSGEQSRSVSQVTAGVSEIAQVTQRNAATAEESASAAEELHAQAETLKAMVVDMVRVIGGIKQEQGGAAMALKRPPVKARSSHAAARPAPRKALPQPVAKSTAKPAATAKTANNIIPMDGDEFTDF